jgi:tRNA(Arg) A34 adenosine deaminase TadA
MDHITDQDREFMRAAIAFAQDGIKKGQAPFAAAVVSHGAIVAAEHDQVMMANDITAHAVIQAIRSACQSLGRIHLNGCSIYTTSEPCPMCFAACHWARLDRIVFGVSVAEIDDSEFNRLALSAEEMKEIGGSEIEIQSGCLSEENKALFEEFLARPNRVTY